MQKLDRTEENICLVLGKNCQVEKPIQFLKESGYNRNREKMRMKETGLLGQKMQACLKIKH